MSDNSVNRGNGSGTLDYATAIANINQAVATMNPASGTAKSLLQTAEELDNAAWCDFSEIRFFLEPAPTPPSWSHPHVPWTAEDLSLFQQIDNQGGDSRNYEEQFYRPFKEAMARGVRDYLLYCPIPHFPHFFSPLIRVEDPATGRISLGGRVFDTGAIVNSLITFLPWQDMADMANSYFSISRVSTSDTWAAQNAFFGSIQQHFSHGYNTWVLLAVYEGGGGHRRPDLVPAIWAALKAKLIGEFGAGSEDIGELEDALTFHPPEPKPQFPFLVFPENDFNLGLRLVYRQEWRPLGIQRGEVVRTIPLGPKQTEKVSTKIVRRSKTTRTAESLKSTEATTETSDTAKDSSEIVNEASSAMKWNMNVEVEGGFNIGIASASVKTSTGFNTESAHSSKETSTHLSETMRKVANKVRTETKVVVSTEFEETFEATSASEIQNPNDEIAITYVFSKLQRQYEILTRLAEVQDVIMVAEELPRPKDIDFDWVKRHDWIIAKVLLDDSFRDALSSISQEVGQPNIDMKNIVKTLTETQTATIKHLGSFAAATAPVTATNIDFAEESQRNYLSTAKEQIEYLKQNYLLDAKRHRLYEHIRENILHYHRAIWQQEDPQQRLLRYRKRGIMVPLEWWFQPDTGAPMTIDQFESSSEAGIQGDFVANMQGPMLPVIDLINPAGPIAFYGNYAVYYMRPEYAHDSEIMPLLEIFKSPYVYNGELMDPVQKEFEENNMADPVRDPMIDTCWEDMLDHVPELRLKYLKALKTLPDSEEEPSAFDLLGSQTFRDFYPEYQFRKEQTRRFLVDTNCLMVDLLPGEGSALEPFKQMHRVVDVLKAEQERVKMSLDNERRSDLLNAGKYGDPDIEKVVVVNGKDTSLVAGLEAQDD